MIIRSKTGTLRSKLLHFTTIDHAASTVGETIIMKKGTYTTEIKHKQTAQHDLIKASENIVFKH